MLEALRQEVRAIYRRMSEDGVIRGSQGNVSALDRERGLVAITPAGVGCMEIGVEDIAVIDLDGQMIEGTCQSTSETPMHIHILRNRPEIHAIVHPHAPYASVFALSHEPIPMVLIESAILGGKVRVAPFCTPGTEALAQVTLEAMGSDMAILLANHGLLTVGPDLGLAYAYTLAAEDTARAVILARSMGAEPKTLDEEWARRFHKKFAEQFGHLG